MRSYLLLAISAAILASTCTATASAQTPTPTSTPRDASAKWHLRELRSLDFKFVNHVQADFPEQDVFIEGDDIAKSEVRRIEGDAAKDPKNLARRVFATATTTEHDPFKVGKNPVGPFAKGRELWFTLAQWLTASGNGTYIIDGDQAEIALAFEKLVPRGLYTVWCSRVKLPPEPRITDKPCGAADGKENTFRADAVGHAKFNLKMKPLPESDDEISSVIAIAFHSDGRTYGANPGKFGFNSHVQLFYMIPPVEAKTAVPEPLPPLTGQGGLSTFTIILIIIAGLAVLGWMMRERPSDSQSGAPPTSSK